MTVEVQGALIILINAMVLFINRGGLTKLVSRNNKDNVKKIDKLEENHKAELAKRDKKLELAFNELAYYRSVHKQDLKDRLEITNDEAERQRILDKLETLSKFQ